MRKLLLTIAMTLMGMAGATAQTFFDIKADDLKNSAKEIKAAAKEIATDLTTEWRNANANLTTAEQDSILQGVEPLTANRYLVVSATEDTSVVSLGLSDQPVGLVVLVKGGEPLCAAYVNDEGKTEYIMPKEGNDALKAVVAQMNKGNRYVICGIEQPYKLFHNEDYKEYATDMTTGETTVYDTSSLPDYVLNVNKHHTAAVIGSVAGGLAAAAIIVLCVVL